MRRDGTPTGSLEAGDVDQRTDRYVQRDPDQTAHGKRRADGRLVPMRLSQQEDPE